MESIDFEDDRANLNKESRFRRHTLRIFNKRRENFNSDAEYDDYLEMIEDVVFNLSNDVDVEATKLKVEMYRKENQDLIGQNQALRAEEERKALEVLARAERERVAKLVVLRKRDAEIEEEARRKRLEEEREELQRVALGDAEAAKIKKKKEKRAIKEKRRLEREQAATEAAARAEDPDLEPMFCRPAFPNPQPNPLLSEGDLVKDKDVDPVSCARAGGYTPAIAMDRALAEFADSLAL